MSFFTYKNGEMHAEGVTLASIAAQVGTPFYCYSAGALRAAWKEFADGMKGMNASICYAMKANSNLAVVRLFGEMGAGADIVSVGEMRRALAAGIPANRIIYSGVGKKPSELMAAPYMRNLPLLSRLRKNSVMPPPMPTTSDHSVPASFAW